MNDKELHRQRIDNGLLLPVGKLFTRCLWVMLLIWVIIVALLLTLIPDCQLLDTPGAKGCIINAIDYSGIVTLLLFFNILWVFVIAAIQEIGKEILAYIYVSTTKT